MTSSAVKADVSFDFREAWVLMVDQSAGFMDIAAQMLRGFGFKKFDRFADLDRYSERRQELAPDLILIDPFPERDRALAFIESVRKREAVDGSSMLVIVVTSKPSAQVVTAARECGADYVVAKPFSPKVLLDRILWSANADAELEFATGDRGRGAGRQGLR